MSNNMETYGLFASVPDEAKKPISAGRLKGMTDINPMWRIKKLTERYGPCGTGWKYVITEKQILQGADGVICAFMDIDLFVKENGEWSDAIPGTGGSQFVSKENKGLYTNDECFKMALTDAISVACKALGMGADVYWESGRTKYDLAKNNEPLTYETALTLEVNFGKHNGKTLQEIYKTDRPYIAYLSEKSTDLRIKEAIIIIEKEIAKSKAPAIPEHDPFAEQVLG